MHKWLLDKEYTELGAELLKDVWIDLVTEPPAPGAFLSLVHVQVCRVVSVHAFILVHTLFLFLKEGMESWSPAS